MEPTIRIRTRKPPTTSPRPAADAAPDDRTNPPPSPRWLDEDDAAPTALVASDPVQCPTEPTSPGRGTYEVGYGKPPVHTRFKPGNRANPQGRPRGAKSFKNLLEEKLNAKVTVTEGGKKRKMTKIEIGTTKLANKFAETGDLKTALLLFREADAKDEKESSSSAPLLDLPEETSPTDEAMLAWLKDRLMAQAIAVTPGASIPASTTGEET